MKTRWIKSNTPPHMQSFRAETNIKCYNVRLKANCPKSITKAGCKASLEDRFFSIGFASKDAGKCSENKRWLMEDSFRHKRAFILTLIYCNILSSNTQGRQGRRLQSFEIVVFGNVCSCRSVYKDECRYNGWPS